MKGLGRFLGRLLAVLLVLGLASLAYLHVQGFPPFLQQFLFNQLRRAGIEAHFGTLRFDMFRGIVATEAVIADAAATDHILARVDELQLQINWRRLVQRQNALAGIRIANATVSVPTPPDELGPAEFTADEAYAVVRFEDDGTIRIDQLTGVYCGIRLYVTGQLKPRMLPPPASAKPAAASPFGIITRTVRELNRLQVQTAPQLDLDFDLDLARPLEGRAHVRLAGADLRYRNLVIRSARVELDLVQQVIHVRQFAIQVANGEVSAGGQYDIGGGRFDLHLASDADLQAFLTFVPPATHAAMGEVKLPENPRITLRYFLSPETGTQPELEGTIATGPVEFRGVGLRALELAFHHDHPLLVVTRARLETAEGRLIGHGQIDLERSDFSYEIDSTVDPTGFLPIMTGGMRRVVEPSWFETPPQITARVRGDFVDPDNFAYEAEVRTQRCRYRGVELTGAAGALRLEQNHLDVQDLVLTRSDGAVRGAMQVDFNEPRVQFDLESTANPRPLSPLLGPNAAEFMKPYSYGPNFRGRAQGLVDFVQPRRTAWRATIGNDQFAWQNLTAGHADGELVFTNNQVAVAFNGRQVRYGVLSADEAEGTLAVRPNGFRANLTTKGFAFWKLKADEARGTLLAVDRELQVDEFVASLYGGECRGRARFGLAGPETTYDLDLTLDRCDVRRYLQSQGHDETEVSGQLSGQVRLAGRGDDVKTLSGEGGVEISEGVLMEVGLFGFISRVLNDISPGMGSAKFTNARASFRVADNALRTEDLRITASGFTIEGKGAVGLDGALDFRLQAHFLQNIPGVNLAAKLLGKIFEYKVGGTVGDPKYRPLHLPKEVLPHGG